MCCAPRLRAGWGSTFTTAPQPAEFGSWQQDDQARQLIEDATRIVEAVTQRPGLSVKSEVLSRADAFASAAGALIDLTAEAQMIVVGSRRETAPGRGLLGSVATGLVHHAHCPMAVIHDDAADLNSSQAPVLVGVDGSAASKLACAIAFDEASCRGVELVALHACSDFAVGDFAGLKWPAIESDAHAKLTDWLADWQRTHPDMTVDPVVVGDQPARQLLDRSQPAQLVVVGSRGRGGFAGMLLGSVSTAIVHAAHIPVIVARRLTAMYAQRPYRVVGRIPSVSHGRWNGRWTVRQPGIGPVKARAAERVVLDVGSTSAAGRARWPGCGFACRRRR